jgi:RimJ/RimL family protein N-acetyltransferase
MELDEQQEEFDLRKVKWRLLSLLDIKEFRIAAQESTQTNYEYLAYGAMFESISPFDYAMTYSNMLFKDPVDHYGLFDKGKLLGHMSFGMCFGQFGTEVIGWVRSGYHNKGVGELGLAYAEQIAFERKNFNFVSLNISQKNKPSRRVAEKAGFKPVLKMAYQSGGSDCSVLYIKINPRIERLARQYGRRAIDAMNTPAGFAGMGHYLLSDGVVEFYGWPFPPFEENGRPVNGFAFDDFTARINFSPNVLEGHRSSGDGEQGLA